MRSLRMKSAKRTESTEGLFSKVAQTCSLVEYQKGAVVSRTLLDKKTGTVTLFAFDEGQGLSEHTVPYDAIVAILDGEAVVTISSKPIRLKAGEMTIMPANNPHSLKALARFKMLLVMIRSA